ncbi:Heteroproteinous nuclear ribonucleoprotein A1 [Coemansia sp. RSA 1199]|nr:Heteroproteinous nuclear ribonucleoprotein A1 [Coemansia sp. RSA 1199]
MADNSLYADAGDSYIYGGAGDADTQWLYNDNQALATNQQEQPSQNYANPNANNNGNSVNDNSANDNAAAPPRPSGGSSEEGKLFVGGLSWETDESRLHSYFSKYGLIMECSIMRDQNTNRPRGFGFVTFDSIDGVNAVLQEPTHTLDGKQIDPKHAIPRENHPAQARPNYSQQPAASSRFDDPVKEMKGEKIFVGGLPPSATDADLNSFFGAFGTIVDTKLVMDRETGRSRNYGFLQFDNEESALQAVKAGNTGEGILIHGKRVDVNPAVRQKPNPMMGMMGMQGMQGYGMMGMPGYGMMGMPGYGMMGMPNMYGMMAMPGYGGSGEGADAANAYYAQMGYYNQDSQGDPSAVIDQSGSNPNNDQSADSKGGNSANGQRRYDDRNPRSSSRRHGSNDNRSGRDRPRGDRGDRNDRGGSSRGSRYNRDREGPVRNSHGSSSSRNRGYNPY